MLLEGGVQPFEQNQEVHGVHEQVQHAITLRMYRCKTLRAHELLALLAEDCGTNVLALITLRHYVYLRRSVRPPMAIDVTLPEAFDAKVVEAIITSERSWIILTLFTSLLRLYDVAVGHVHQHGFVLLSISFTMHELEALEAEVILAVGTIDLGFLHGA